MDVRQALESERLIGIVRTSSAEGAAFAAQAAIDAGLKILEFTLNTPGALGLIERFASGPVIVGVGTVTDADEAESAIASGARFVVTPVASRVVVDACRGRGVPVVCGTATPTEMWNAHRWGADLVKVFPIAALGGADYIRLVRGPLDQIPIVATGGISMENVDGILDAGAVAVGVTSDLFDPASIDQGDAAAIAARTREFIRACRRSPASDVAGRA